MKVDTELVEHVARNARLKLTAEEKLRFAKEIGEVINAFSALKEADTSGVEPSAQPIPIGNRLRADEPAPSLPQDEALANAQHKRDGLFRGPKAV